MKIHGRLHATAAFKAPDSPQIGGWEDSNTSLDVVAKRKIPVQMVWSVVSGITNSAILINHSSFNGQYNTEKTMQFNTDLKPLVGGSSILHIAEVYVSSEKKTEKYATKCDRRLNLRHAGPPERGNKRWRKMEGE
jgi:hypothetical protein